MAQWDLGIIDSSGGGSAIPLTGSSSFYYTYSEGAGLLSYYTGYDEYWNYAPMPIEMQQLSQGQKISFLNTEKYGYNIDGIELTVTYVTYYGGDHISIDYVVTSSTDAYLHDIWISSYPSFSGVNYFGYDNLQLVL